MTRSEGVGLLGRLGGGLREERGKHVRLIGVM